MVRIQSSKDEPKKKYNRSKETEVDVESNEVRFSFTLFPNGIFTTFRPERHKKKRRKGA